MIKLNKIYRQYYFGENIVVNRNYTNGVWQDTTEYVPNAVINNQISNRAAVIGNGPSRLEFDLSVLNNPAGLLGKDTLQTYGCNALYRNYSPDFLVAVGSDDIIKEISNSTYIKSNIVYTNSTHLLEYPNKFYLIPHDPYSDAGTEALYIAAFDGHKTIYMLGFDGQDTEGFNYNVYADTIGYDPLRSTVPEFKWVADRVMVFNTYNDVDFVKVSPRGTDRFPDEWKYCNNVRHISFREFVLEANL